MRYRKKHIPSIAQNDNHSHKNRRCSECKVQGKNGNHSHAQLELFPQSLITPKPQVTSIPGVSPRELHRYRVKIGDQILGDRLTIDEALELARGGAR